MLDKHRSSVDPAAFEIAQDAFRAGEFEVAAISIVEDAPASADELRELELLAAVFDPPDREIAERVIAKRRKQNHSAGEPLRSTVGQHAT